MNVVLFVGFGCLVLSFVSIVVYRWQLRHFAPGKYAELKALGRFRYMPDTWEEFWLEWNEKPSEWVKKMEKIGGMPDVRVTYGVFVDKYLLPVGFVRPVGQFALLIGVLLLVIYGIWWMF